MCPIAKYMLMALLLSAEFTTAKAQTAAIHDLQNSEIMQTLVSQEKIVQARFPDAKLFQVFILDAIPKPSKKQESQTEIHSLFELVPKRTYAEAVDRLGHPKNTEIHSREFGGRDCFYGHPQSERETCGPTVERPANLNEYLTLNWYLDLGKLATVLSEHNLDPSGHFDITIVSAARVIKSLHLPPTRLSSAPEVAQHLAALNPTDAVVTVTEQSESRTQAGHTSFLSASDESYLGSVRPIQSNRLPPTR